MIIFITSSKCRSKVVTASQTLHDWSISLRPPSVTMSSNPSVQYRWKGYHEQQLVVKSCRYSVVVSNHIYIHIYTCIYLYVGAWSNLTEDFQTGWNHHLGYINPLFFLPPVCFLYCDLTDGRDSQAESSAQGSHLGQSHGPHRQTTEMLHLTRWCGSPARVNWVLGAYYESWTMKRRCTLPLYSNFDVGCF